jgi:ribosomal protein S12 methylthiotransferase
MCHSLPIAHPALGIDLAAMKIGMISLGCPKNLVDSEVMLGLAADAGHELTRNPADADVLVVNTCAFIDQAKQESIDTILEMAQHKTDGRCRRLVVAGCLAERYRDELRDQIPEIDAVIGTGEVPRILDAIGAPGLGVRDSGLDGLPIPLLRANGEEIRLLRTSAGSRLAGSRTTPDSETRIPSPEPPPRDALRRASRAPSPGAPGPGSRPSYLYDADTPRLLATPRHYAYVKIAEGCDYKCAFCIIPTLRGAYRSRTDDSIVAEARALAGRGAKELLLVSQDTSFYGVDRGERGALARLLRRLDDVDGIEWIRLMYLYPTTIGDDVLEVMASSTKTCRYIDLPLQHASDPVLRRMKRPGSRAGYERLLDRIRRRVPGVTLRTTFVVGFPGETEADFAQLLAFAGDMQFDHVGVFTYSHEEGTSGFRLPDDVPAAVKRRRQAKLMSLQRRLVVRRQASRVGERVRLLVDGPSAEHGLVLRARTAGQAPDIDGCVYLTDADPSLVRPGAFLDAEIVASQEYDLVARPLAVPA